MFGYYLSRATAFDEVECGAVGREEIVRDTDLDDDGVLNINDRCPGYDDNGLDTDGDGTADECDLDIDGDGFNNDFELNMDSDPLLDTSTPLTVDNDENGMADLWEDHYGVTDPTVDGDSDGLTNAEEYAAGTDPTISDTDGDGLADGTEAVYGSDPTDPDTDNDALPDGVEVSHGTDPILADTDADGLTDFEELATYGTNPTNPDSDGDGVNDGDEIAAGTDPRPTFSFTRMTMTYTSSMSSMIILYSPSCSGITPITAESGVSTDFTVSTTGTITSYEWDFGDGSTDSTTTGTTSYTYAAEEAYPMTVTITDGTNTNMCEKEITVSCGTVSPLAVSARVSESFTVTPNSFNTYRWDFGDGSSVTTTASASNRHSYMSGTYPLTVTATDGTDTCVITQDITAT